MSHVSLLPRHHAYHPIQTNRSTTVTTPFVSPPPSQPPLTPPANPLPGGKTLLNGADLHLAYARRYGLIGKNGIGKTTLLRHMAAFDIEGFPRHHRVLHVQQEVADSDASVVDTVLGSDVELMALLAKEKELVARLDDTTAEDGKPAGEGAGLSPEEVTALSAELAGVYDRLKAIDASTAEARAGTILAGLGFTQVR